MPDYLPHTYQSFRAQHPDVAEALDHLGEVTDSAGPLSEKEQRLAKLGLSIGALAQGAVRSNARKALDAGASPAEIRHIGVLAITTCGFPTAIAGLGWIEEVLDAEA